jgi:hypothetical protein
VVGIPLPEGVTSTFEQFQLAQTSYIKMSRVTSFSVDLLDNDENYIGPVPGVLLPAGKLSWDTFAAVKSGGTIPIRHLAGNDVDWLNVRVKVTVSMRNPNAERDNQITYAELGIYIPSAPKEVWDEHGSQWDIELIDKLSILDSDVIGSGNRAGQSYSLPKGTNILSAVRAIITEAGESAAAIGSSSKVLAAPMMWEAGVTRLKIINDLLDTANYFSLWCDNAGDYRATPYKAPKDRDVLYKTLKPFVAGSTSVLTPGWTQDKDIYTIPNRVVVVGQGSGDTPALSAVATNTDPKSPYSFPNRKRWITEFRSGVEATSQTDLNAHASRLLTSLTSVAGTFEVKHLFIPDLTINSVVQFSDPDAGIDTLATVVKTTIPIDPLDICTTTLQEVLR